MSYETPDLVFVGDFTEVTRIKSTGNTPDSPWGAWFCIGVC